MFKQLEDDERRYAAQEVDEHYEEDYEEAGDSDEEYSQTVNQGGRNQITMAPNNKAFAVSQ